MNLTLKKNFKSLEPFRFKDLPDFCVITGRNGTGKTQLLELIKLRKESVERTANGFEIDIDQRRIQYEGLSASFSSTAHSTHWNNTMRQFFNDYNSFHHFMEVFHKLFTSIPGFTLLNKSLQELYELLVNHAQDEMRSSLQKAGEDINTPTLFQSRIRDYADQFLYRIEALEAAWIVSVKTRKSLFELRERDFYHNPPEERLLGKQHLFGASIENLFYAYAKRRHINFMHLVGKQMLGREYDCIPDAEFTSLYPEPWILINQVLKDSGLPYYFTGIEPDDLIEGDPVFFHLKKSTNHKTVDFQSLSSGEKVIMTLIFSLFIKAFYGEAVNKPELLVLDEPDAHLHPAMSKLLIKVLHETFVKGWGLKIIMTTHSPSTVAMAPDESLYELRNEPKTELLKVTKDDALKTLMSGVPTLSIDYLNHRQVFVESETDVFYYQNIYEVMSENLQLTHQLYFIASGNSGNVTVVKTLVEKLRSAGNAKVYGVIDWDAKNEPADFIQVHGKGEFYSIENIIYLTVYLGLHFMVRSSETISKDLQVPERYQHYEFGIKEPLERIQQVSDWIIQKIVKKFPALKDNSNMIDVHFNNNKTVKVPAWYLQMRGHELEEKLKKTFLSLEKYRNEGDLQRELTLLVVKSYPFTPTSSCNIIKSLSAQ